MQATTPCAPPTRQHLVPTSPPRRTTNQLTRFPVFDPPQPYTVSRAYPRRKIHPHTVGGPVSPRITDPLLSKYPRVLPYATVMSCLSDRTRLRLTTTPPSLQFHAQGTITRSSTVSRRAERILRRSTVERVLGRGDFDRLELFGFGSFPVLV
jgi:hypothetical protein